MAEGLKTVRIVTSDEALLASARGAVSGIDGWQIHEPQSTEEILAGPPDPGDVILIDAWLRTENVYESCRRMTGKVRCRIFVITDERNEMAAEIASFCGAAGMIPRPLSGAGMEDLLLRNEGPRVLPEEFRTEDGGERTLPERLLRDLGGEGASRVVDAITDPETGLFSYDYLSYKLDEEFKRAKRFGQSLTCVMLGFEGQVEDEVLAELAGIFLNCSRDTDILGRFDQTSFLFFLPNTGPDGAQVMAERIRTAVDSQGARDLVGDPLTLSVGISFCPHPQVKRSEDLFERARNAFLTVQSDGGVLVSRD
jgi:diguanylate cyclase (GGDEF)-like protein